MNRRQQRFVQEYLLDLNATQAAIRAGYNEKTAYSQGQRLLKNVEVKTAIDTCLNDISSAKIADIQEIMEYLTAVMRGETIEQIPILIGNGVQQLITKAPSAKDRIRAAELLGKRFGLFTDKVGIDGVVPVVIMGDDQLED